MLLFFLQPPSCTVGSWQYSGKRLSRESIRLLYILEKLRLPSAIMQLVGMIVDSSMRHDPTEPREVTCVKSEQAESDRIESSLLIYRASPSLAVMNRRRGCICGVNSLTYAKHQRHRTPAWRSVSVHDPR